jgi:Na+-driven multidrug efflux pump
VLIGEFFPIAVVSIFTEPTPDLVEVAVYAIRIYFIAYLPMGLNIISATFHQSLEASREATLISLGRGLFFLVPVLFLLSSLFGVGGIWATVPVSEFLTLLLSALLLKRLFASRLSDND